MKILGGCFLKFVDCVIFSDRSSGNRNRRVYFEGRKHLNAFILAKLLILIAIYSPNPKHSIVFVDPFIELIGEVQ